MRSMDIHEYINLNLQHICLHKRVHAQHSSKLTGLPLQCGCCEQQTARLQTQATATFHQEPPCIQRERELRRRSA